MSSFCRAALVLMSLWVQNEGTLARHNGYKYDTILERAVEEMDIAY